MARRDPLSIRFGPGTGLLVQWQAHHNRKTFGYIIDVRRVQLDVRFIEDDREKGLVALTVVARCMALYGVIEIRGVALRTVFVTQGAVPRHSFGIVFINCLALHEALTTRVECSDLFRQLLLLHGFHHCDRPPLL